MQTQFESFFKPFWKQIVVSLLVVIYIAINIFRVGGDSFVINLNNFIVTPLALAVTFLAFRLWRQVKPGTQNRLLWLGLTIGWAMWAIAELWWSIAGLITQEVPYPSWADFFWLVGYLPVYYALWNRLSSLPKNTNPGQQIGIWGVITLFITGFTVLFILIPIIRDSDPSIIVESIISVAYPLADLVVLILVIQLWLTYQQGEYGRVWQWLTMGFIFSSFGDLLFAYAETINMYYPNQQVNLLSTIVVDVPYNLSYLLWIVGLVLMQKLFKNFQPIAVENTKLELVPNTHLLVFTGMDDKVMDTGVSQNYTRVFLENEVKGKTIQEVLGISAEDADAILKDGKANKVIKERKILATTRFGQEPIWVSGIAIFNPQGEYSGIYLLVRMFTNDYSLDKLLTDYQNGMVRSLLNKTGAEQKEQAEIKQLLADYYQAFFYVFQDRVIAKGGAIFADAFITELKGVVKQQGWQVEIQPNSLIDISKLSLSEVRKALPILLETAKQFIDKLTDEESANAIVQDVRSKFGELALSNVSYFESAKTDRT